MKIIKKQTVFEIGNGVKVKQSAWAVLTNTLIQCEFRIEHPPHFGCADSFGAIGVFLSDQVDRIRFMLCPEDIHEKRRDYQKEDVNFIEFSGNFSAADHTGFSHNLVFQPKFDDGWCFEFTEAISQFRAAPSEYDANVTAEKIIADITCSDSFKISFGRRYVGQGAIGPVSVHEPLVSLTLQDAEGLRLAIKDVLGIDYLRKLLRKNGYEVDAISLCSQPRE